MVLNALVTPIYLVIITYHFAVKHPINLWLGIVGSIASLYGSIFIQYWNWGTTTGMFLTPDAETVRMVMIEVIISTVILSIGMLVLFIIKSRQT